MSISRERKGFRIAEFPNDYTIIDLETTGFVPGTDKIIEFAAVKVRDNQVIDEVQQLFNPKTLIRKSVEKLTGISNNMVAYEPLIEDELAHLIEWIGSDIIVGHNVNFDIDFLYDECMKVLNRPFENNYFDTLYVCKKLYPETSHKLTDMISVLNIKDDGIHHRALADCNNTYKLLCILKTNPDIDKIIEPQQKKKQFIRELSQTTQSLRALQDIIVEVTCDNILTKDEVIRLRNWLSDNEDLTGNYPYDIICSSINKVLEDGIIEDSELDYLLKILKEQLDPLENKHATIGSVDLVEKCVCLSGDFSYGSKAEYSEKLSSHGAIIVNNVTKKTDILIVGSEGASNWSNGNFGIKIKKALEMQEKGHRIKILKEEDVQL